MPDTFTTNLNLDQPAVNGDVDTWGSIINSDLGLVDAVFNGDGSGTSVGLNVGAGKALKLGGIQTITGTLKSVVAAVVQFVASTFSLLDDTDPTKVVKFLLSGLTTATTRTLTVPDASGTLILDTAAQTLTNKTIDQATCVGPLVPTGLGPLPWPMPTPPTGWVLHKGSIGDASSGATTRANADTQALFVLLWANPNYTLQNSAGTAIAKGATAAADYAAHARLVLPDVGTQFPQYVTDGSNPGTVGGAATHTHSLSVTGSQTFTFTGNTNDDGWNFATSITGGNGFVYGAVAGAHFHAYSGSVLVNLTSTGTSGSASNLPPYMTVTGIIKL